MQNKKLYIILVVAIVIVAASAFVGGRLLNGQIGSLGFLPFGNGGGMVSMAVNMIPAPELPTAQPITVGTFAERKDNTLTIQTFSMETGSGGSVQVAAAPAGSDSSPVTSAGNEGPKVEVVVTNKTLIYRDVTEMNMEPPTIKETTTIQQVVEAGTLDDLKNQSMVMVWGRKNGDRIIADVISYSNPVVFKK